MEGRGREPGHMKEDSPVQDGAGSRVGSCGHMALSGHLDGDLPEALSKI